MNKLLKLIEQHNKAKDVADARWDRVTVVLYPILDVFGIHSVHIEDIDCKPNGVEVRYGWSCRGQSDYDRVFIPNSIIEADDMKQAAQQYIEEQQKRKRESEIKETQRQIERLQAKLNNK